MVEYLPSKQGVAGSSPVSRSRPHEFRIGVLLSEHLRQGATSLFPLSSVANPALVVHPA